MIVKRPAFIWVGAPLGLRQRRPQKSFFSLRGGPRWAGHGTCSATPAIRRTRYVHARLQVPTWRTPRPSADGSAILNYIRQTAASCRRQRDPLWPSGEARVLLSQMQSGPWRPRPGRRKRSLVSPATSSISARATTTTRVGIPRTGPASSVRRADCTPQKWPEDLDYAGKQVVVIGSGATAVTLVPAMAERRHTSHAPALTSYVVSRPTHDKLANWLRRRLPAAPHTRSRVGKTCCLDVLL